MSVTRPKGFFSPDETASLRVLAFLGAIGLIGFEVIYYLIEIPSGPLALRCALVAMCIAYSLVMHLYPAWRRYAYSGAVVIAVLVTFENIYRMHLVNFALSHSIPMLTVLVAASYVFRSQLSMTAFLIAVSIALTITMYVTPNSEVPPYAYIATVWVFCVITFIVYGLRVKELDQLHAQERLLNGIFEESYGGLLLISNDELVLVNDRAKGMLGTNSGKEIIARLKQALAAFYGTHVSSSLQDHIERGARRDEVAFNFDGRRLWIDVHLRSFDLSDQSMLLVSLHDVTSQKNAMVDVTRSELFLKKSQRIGSIGSWDIDLETGDITWSLETYRIYGLDPSVKLTGELTLGMLDSESEATCREALQSLTQLGDRTQLELKARIGGGEEVWLRIVCEVIELSGVLHLVGITQDVTADRLGQQALIEAKETAEEALKVRGRFLANMSHEIRTPMNGVIGMASLLMASNLTSSQRDAVRTLKQSGESLLVLINDILDFSKIDADKIELERRDFEFKEVMSGSLELLRLSAEQKSIFLNIEVAKDFPQRLRGDATRLEQILVNLTSNGVKFTHRGGVTVSFQGNWLSRDRFELDLTVSDTGVGVDPERTGHLFEAFTQEDSSTTRRFGGTGLGLSITQGLVALMDGEITVSSELGVGTIFRVVIPLAAATEFYLEQSTDEMAAKGEDAPVANRAALRVLLAEDNMVNQKVASKMLALLGHETVLVENGQQAIDSIKANEFDVVLMDLQMPEVDGLDATRKIRAMQDLVQPVVIALTANVMQSDKDECIAAGMNDFLPKPITLDALADKLDGLGT